MQVNKLAFMALMAAAGGIGAAYAAPTAGVAAARSASTQQPAAKAAEDALRQLEAQLAQYKGSLPPGFPFAVADVADLSRARIGYGFEEMHADPQALLGGASLQAAARSTGTWRYTVTVDDRPVGLVTVVDAGGAWKASAIGAAQLAEEVNAIVGQQQSTAASLRFIRVPQATADFIEVQGADDRVRYVPLSGARAALGIRAALVAPTSPIAESDFTAALRDAVATGLAN